MNISKQSILHEETSEMLMLSPNWVCICRLEDGCIIEVNEKFSKGINLIPEEIIGKSIYSLNIIKNQHDFELEIHKNAKKEKFIKTVIELISKKRGVRKGFLSISVFEIKNQHYFTFIFDDRTTFFKIQEQLFDSEERYRSLFDNALAGFYIVSSKNGELIDCNDYFAQLLGYSNSEDAIGSVIPNLLIKSEVKPKKQFVEPYVNEIPLKNISGQVVWVMNYTNELHNKNFIAGVIIDISKRKKVEKQLAFNENRFRLLIENTTDLIFIINQFGACSYVSPALNNVLGYSNRYKLKNIINIISDKDYGRFNDFLIEINNSPEFIHEIAIQVKHKNGTYRTLNVLAKNFLEVPEIGGIIINAQDITDKVKAQEEISAALKKEQELNRQKTQFISTVSHDFRTPLTNIYLNIQLLERYIEEKNFDTISKNVERMSNATKRLTALLNEVSLISKEQSGKLAFNPEIYNSNQLTDLIVEQIDYLFQSNVKVKIIKESHSVVMADRSLMSHIIDNLLSNAIKFSPDKKLIQFTMGISKSGVFKLVIKDNGIGIPPDELKFLFDPYFRASNVNHISGNGLGLSIVKRCIELQKGTITVNSKELKGTTVIVQIPLKC